MCGIVGYVGPRQAVEVVVEGLRRMEYRGYDSAGIALVHQVDGAPTIVGDKRAGKPPTSRRRSPTRRCRPPRPASDTPAGRPTARPPTATHTRTGQHRAGRARAQRHHRELPSLRAELERNGHELVSETDTEVAAHLLEAEVVAGADLTTAMQAVCRRLEGAFTLVAVDAHDAGAVVAARRDSPLVVGLGTARTSSASDVSAFIEHTRDALEVGQARSSRSPATT